MRRRAWLVLLATGVGCASGASYERSGGADAAPVETERGLLDDAEQAEPAETPTATDPYVERAGGPEAPGGPPPRVLFRGPDAPLQTVVDRPALPEPARLAVARVDASALADPSPVLLALEAELSYENDLESVLALGWIEGREEAGFAELTAAGLERDHDLLLVDFAQALFEPGREAYLFDCSSGACLARFGREGPPEDTAGGDDLVARIGRAYAVACR